MATHEYRTTEIRIVIDVTGQTRYYPYDDALERDGAEINGLAAACAFRNGVRAVVAVADPDPHSHWESAPILLHKV